MLALLLLVVQVTAAPPSPDIVVVGKRAERELAACIARNCSPDEEIELTLQTSVEQFTGGRYDDAQRSLQKAIKRNVAYAERLPGPVSSLYATLATVAEHQGNDELWLRSARNNVLTLRRYLGEANSATLGQEIDFADTLIKLGRLQLAEGIYKKVERLAIAQGQGEIAAGSAFRRAWLLMGSGRYKDAERVADEAVGLAAKNKTSMTDLRDILRARIAFQQGKRDGIEALAARLRQNPEGPPKLLYAPPINDINAIRTLVEKDPWHDSKIRFADVGYWVRPDGKTAGVEVLRNAGLGQWAPGILKQIGSRRYIPLSGSDNDAGMYRIDRFTVRATFEIPTGSRIPQRIGPLTVHVVDLTETDAMKEVSRRHARQARLNAGS
jgi:tetratricopeptide (TPR) repeat protein